MRKLLLLALVVMLCGGCSTFRAMFDEDPAVTQQKRERAKQRRVERMRSGDSGDDVFPSLFSGSKKPDTLYVSSSLTPEERAVLEETEAASKRRNPAESEVESIRRENRERSDKISDQVFGGGLRDLL